MAKTSDIDQQSVGPHPTSHSAVQDSVGSKDGVYVQTQQFNDSASDLQGHNPFADPEVAERYAMIYEKAQYECRHVFDPTLTWTPEEEKALVRKLDWRVCLWAVCQLLLLFICITCSLTGYLVCDVLWSSG